MSIERRPNGDHLDGKVLYGDDFNAEEIQRWYEHEEQAYYELATSYYGIATTSGDYDYEYDAFNRFHAYNFLLKHKFERCLAFGCARGDDVAPLGTVVGEFIGVEPVEKWWRQEIGGKPARYMKPTPSAALALPNSSVDLVVALGVLHHIPNVSYVMSELARVLRPGGYFVLREPISWMGDWRRPRAGLTPNERGLPLGWLEKTVTQLDLKPVQLHLCQFRALEIALEKSSLTRLAKSTAFVLADYWLSVLTSWNVRYRRDALWKKIAPSSVFAIYRRA